jgi:hypothetical protein
MKAACVGMDVFAWVDTPPLDLRVGRRGCFVDGLPEEFPAGRDQLAGGGGVGFFGSAAAFLFSAFRAAFSRLQDSIPRFVADDLAARAIRDPQYNRGRPGAYRPRGWRMPGHPGGVKGGGVHVHGRR